MKLQNEDEYVAFIIIIVGRGVREGRMFERHELLVAHVSNSLLPL